MASKTKRSTTTSTSWNTYVRFSHYDIVIVSDDQQECLENFRHKNIHMSRCVYMFILEQVGVVDELIEIVNKMKWRNLYFMKYDEYKNLVHEFYSSLNLTID